jgi:hypothetical protein
MPYDNTRLQYWNGDGVDEDTKTITEGLNCGALKRTKCRDCGRTIIINVFWGKAICYPCRDKKEIPDIPYYATKPEMSTKERDRLLQELEAKNI